MRIVILLGIILFGTTEGLQAQNKSEVEIQKEIYQNSKRYRDVPVARTALYKLIAITEGKESQAYRDTLAQFYFETGSYPECILLSIDILEDTPDKVAILKVKAISEQSMGLNKAALEDYEKLYALSPDINSLYQIASLQYGMLRLGECEMSINKILSDPECEKQRINIISGKQQQEVSMKAAALNMKGVLYRDLKQVEKAKELFNQALSVTPNFVLAKSNLDSMSKESADEKETPEEKTEVEDQDKKGKKKNK